MKALLGLILAEDGSVRDITLLATNQQDRKRAHELLFVAQDEIEKFEAGLKERLRAIPSGPIIRN
jgi:hypothetical protein